MSNVLQADIFPATSNTMLARLTGHNAVIITPATVSSITYVVTDLSTLPVTNVVPTTTVDITTTVQNQATLDGRWIKDEIGYSFIFDVPWTSMPLGNRKYRLEVWFTLTNGFQYPIAYDLTTTPILYGSGASEIPSDSDQDDEGGLSGTFPVYP